MAISASDSGGRARRKASSTSSRPGSTGWRNGSLSPTASTSTRPRGTRMLTSRLRGALDALGAAARVGDPDWVKLRGDKALVLDGKTPALPLASFFALNPAMPNFYRMCKFGEASIVHGAATPYRER